MTVEIRIEPEGRSGIVAEGSYLLDATRRLGVYLPIQCKGRGECDTCAVTVREGAMLLSPLTDSERALLGPERLEAGQRLACQVTIERGGELVVAPVPVQERKDDMADKTSELRKEFSEMPFERKLRTLVELEGVAAYQALVYIADIPFALGGKLMGVMAGKGREMSRRQREARRPSNHQGSDPGSKQ